MYNLRKRKIIKISDDEDDNKSSIDDDTSLTDKDDATSLINDDKSSIDDEMKSFIVDDESNSKSEDENDKWNLDLDPLKKLLVSKIIEKIPDIDKNTIETAVKTSLEETDKIFYEEYCKLIPNDELWKVNVPENEVEKLDTTLKHLREIIKNETPSMKKILESNIPEQNKKRCIQYYDILQNMEPYSEDMLEMQVRINTIMQDKLIEGEQKMKEIEEMNNQYKKRIFELNTTETIKSIIYARYMKFINLDSNDTNYSTSRAWLDFVLSLPFNNKIDLPLNSTPIDVYLTQVYEKMNMELYGMYNVKRRLLEILNNRYNTSNNSNGCVVSLCGKKGVGKTSIVKIFANAIGKPFDKISLGGLDDASTLKGSNQVWSGASPSIILKMMASMKVSDGVILYDEIDKIGKQIEDKK